MKKPHRNPFIYKSKDLKYGASRDNLSSMQSVEDDSWSSINSFGSKKVESTSSPSMNDLRCGRLDPHNNQNQPSHQFKQKPKQSTIWITMI